MWIIDVAYGAWVVLDSSDLVSRNSSPSNGSSGHRSQPHAKTLPWREDEQQQGA